MIGKYVKVKRDGVNYTGSIVGQSSGGTFDIQAIRSDGEKIMIRNLNEEDIIDTFDPELLMLYSDQVLKARDFFLQSNEDFNSQNNFFKNYEEMAINFLGSDNKENILKILKIHMEPKHYKLQDLKTSDRDFEKTCLHLINFLSMMLILKEKSEEDA